MEKEVGYMKLKGKAESYPRTFGDRPRTEGIVEFSWTVNLGRIKIHREFGEI